METAQIAKHNDAYAKSITDFLSAIPKAVAYKAAQAAINSAMEADKQNYAYGTVATLGGDRTPHDSSNAAFNWRIAATGTISSGVDLRGKGYEVGDNFDKRSGGVLGRDSHSDAQYQSGNIQQVIDYRVDKDIKKNLFNHLFKKQTSKTGYSFKLYNNIDTVDPSGEYAKNANLVKVTAKAKTVANSGAILGDAIWRTFATSGTPDLHGLINSVRN